MSDGDHDAEEAVADPGDGLVDEAGCQEDEEQGRRGDEVLLSGGGGRAVGCARSVDQLVSPERM